MRKVFLAVIFIFALVTASCRFFFDTYPFGLAVVSAVSGVFAGGAAVLGTVTGALLGMVFGDAAHGGYLALLSVLAFAARLVVSWWLRQSDHTEKRIRGTPMGRIAPPYVNKREHPESENVM